MRIERLSIKGFGCLRERTYVFPPDRAMLVLEDNETGKSTLAAAIIAGLCSFPKRRRSGEAMKSSEVYEPWDGGTYALEMEIEAGGKRLRVERDFGKGSFVVRDADTNRNVSADYDPDLALHFLRLSRDDFQRIAFISGKEAHRFSSSATLRSRLTDLVDGAHDESGADTAVAALERARYSLTGGDPILIRTAVSRLSESIEERRRRMAELDSSLDAAGEKVGKLDTARSRHQELTDALADLDREYCSARLAEVRARIESAESNSEELAALEEELGELESSAAFPVERAGQISNAVTRVGERERQIGELNDKSEALAAEADEIDARLNERTQFSLATEEDVVGLSAAADVLSRDHEALEAARKGADTAASAPGRWVARSLMTLGGVCAVVSAMLAILGILQTAPGLIGVAIGVALTAAGWLQAAKVALGTATARAGVKQAAQSATQAREQAVRRLSALGVECGPESDIVESLGRTRDALSKYLADRKQRREIEVDVAALGRDIDTERRNAEEESKIITSVLGDAKIDASVPLEQALSEFDESKKRYYCYRQLKNDLIPAATKHVMPDESLQKLKEEETGLVGRLGDAQLAVSRASSEVEAQRQSVGKELERTLQEVRGLENDVGAVVGTYRREYPVLEEELRELERELEKASRFEQAIGIARDMIKEVSEDSHRRWAAALNEQASAILPNLNPDYDTLRFDDSLGFTIRHRDEGRIIERDEIDARLSTGAKDQIYLTVRLACCRELSRLGESMPIILDDPLMSADDERFRRGFRHLVEDVAEDQQVIILSCHRGRHEGLRAEEWFQREVHMVGIGEKEGGNPQ